MLTDKERMELLNLRKRVQAQREEIKRLREKIEALKKGGIPVWSSEIEKHAQAVARYHFPDA